MISRTKLVKMAALQTLLFAGVLMTFALPARAACDNIQTDKGPVNGVLLDDGACAFLGVPFAAPPVGELRFKRPVDHAPWTTPLAADKVGFQCPQVSSPMSDTSIPMNEDCLYLNVWRPEPASAPKPVMVFIHGGGFLVGSGGNATYNGATLAQRGDVVVVTINYRLGVLGFLAHPAFTGENGRTGNWGMYDQLAALKWVQKNIANFGGDPNNVTLFGHSAGSMSVGLHLASPLDAGLFKNAILHSGPPIVVNVGMDKASADGVEIARTLGCTDPATAKECLRSVSVDKILADVPLGIFVMDDGQGQKFFMSPVIDGEFIPDSPYKLFRDGKFNKDVTVFLGTTKDEAAYFTMSKTLKENSDFHKSLLIDINAVRDALGLDFAPDADMYEKMYPIDKYPSVAKAYQDFICDLGFTCPTEILGHLILKYNPNVYRFYHTKDPIKIFNWGAFHGADLPYVFGNFSMMGQNFKSKDNLKLAKIAIGYWSAIAWTGAPKVDGQPEWPRYDAEHGYYLEIGDNVGVGTNLKKDKCEPMENVFKKYFGD